MKEIKDFKRVEVNAMDAVVVHFIGELHELQTDLKRIANSASDDTKRIIVSMVESWSDEMTIFFLRPESDKEYRARYNEHIRLNASLNNNKRNSIELDIKHLKKELEEKEQLLKSSE